MRASTPGFDAAIFSRGFLSRHTRRWLSDRGARFKLLHVHVSSRERKEGVNLLSFIIVTTAPVMSNVISTIFCRFLGPCIEILIKQWQRTFWNADKWHNWSWPPHPPPFPDSLPGAGGASFKAFMHFIIVLCFFWSAFIFVYCFLMICILLPRRASTLWKIS